MKKKCTKCNIEKELIDFHKNHSGEGTYYSWCKKCKNSNSKKNNPKYHTTREKWNQECRADYLKRNKEHISEYSKKYVRENKEIIKEKRKVWNKNNREKIKEYYKSYLPNYINSGKRKESNKKYQLKNKNNPQYKLRQNISSRIYDALKKNYKKSKTSELLGCKIDFYKLYLESLFFPEMTWENYGKIWEIDHIIPCSKFDLLDLESQKQCFNYMNTEPRFKTTTIAEAFGYKNYIGNKEKKDKLL